jgi:hypothetical protein
MKKFLSLILFFALSLPAFADAPLIWNSSQYAKFLTTLGFQLYDLKQYRSLTVDPSAGAGIVAPIGSVGVRDNGGSGEMWLKTAAANTGWSNVLNAASGWSVTGNAGTNPAVNFLGTTDATDLVLRTNNTEYLRITSAGAIDTTLGLGIVHSSAAGILTSSAVDLASADVTGILPRGNGGTGVSATTIVDLFNQLDPLTTKGDILGHDGTDSVRVPVGADGSFLTADSAQATGLSYTSPSSIAWLLTGNTGTDDTVNFMGTTDGEDVVFKSNNTELMRIQQAGPVLVKDSVQLEDPGAGTNAISLISPTPLAAPYTFTFPVDMGTNNYVLTTNGVSTTSWQDANSLVTNSAWALLGNAGTNDAVNFMGTTDAQDVVFKANNNEVMRLEETGQSLLVGTTSPAPFAIAAVRTSADPVGSTGGMYSILNTTRTVNGGSLSSAVQGDSRGQVDVGITDSLGTIGGLFNAYRNTGAGDAGTMGYLVGIYGGSVQSASAGTTSIGAGVFTQSNWSQGTVTDAYDFYAAPATIGATITNRYGIYVAPDVPGKINYLADRLAVGASYTPPTHTLEVQNGEMTQNKAATDTTAVGGLFTDSTHTTVNGSNNAVGVQTSVSATVDAGALNDKVAGGTVNTVTRGDGTDDGTLEEVNGDTSIMFINSGAAGITNKVVGFDVATILQQGTVVDLYDFRSVTVPAGGTATNQYGIYLGPGAGGVKQSWIADRTVLGSTSFSAPNTSLDVNGDLAFRMTADASVGVVTALSTTSTSAIRLTGAGAVTLQGIAGGVEGKILTLSNQTGAVLTVANQNGGAGATDRIITGTGASMSISNDAALVLQYDATQQKWLVIAAPSSGGGGGGTASVKFTLSGAVVPYVAIDGVHNQTTIQSLTNIYVSALNSGTSGTTVVRVNQYRAGALIDSQTASLASNAGLPDGSFAALSGTLSLQVGDIISVDVDSAAAGASELSVEY